MEEYKNVFWERIESKMGTVPIYLKNILMLMGYDSAISIKTINQEDIASFQIYLTSDGMRKRIPKDAKMEHYFGVFAATPENAHILPGHVKLLEQIVEFVKITLVRNGNEYFTVKTKVNQAKNHKDIPKTLSAQENPTEKQIGEQSTASIPMHAQSVSIVEENSDPSNDAQVIVQQNTGQLEERLLEKVVSWMRKNHQSVYEEYAHAFTLNMIEVTPSNKESGLSVGVRCPVCRELVPSPFVSGKGRRSDFYSPSNFHRHLVSHTQTKKTKRITRSSKASVTKRKLIDKTSRPSKKQRKNDTSSESGDSNSENESLAKELIKNYVNESDDVAETDVEDNDLGGDEDAVDTATKDGAVPKMTEKPGPSTRTTNKTKSRKK